MMRTLSKKTGIPILFFAVFCPQLLGMVEFPLVQSMTFFPFFENKTLDRNKFSLSLYTNYSNIYSLDFDETAVCDFEMGSFTICFRYGLPDHFTLEVYYRYFFVYGGFLDKGIEAFHEFFDLPGARRDNYPENSVNYFYKDYFQYDQPFGSSSPLVFSLMKKFVDSSTIEVYGRLFLGIPVISKPGFVSDKLFWGTGAFLKSSFKNYFVEASASISFIQKPEWLGNEDLYSVVFNCRLQLGYKRFFSGFVVETTPFKEGYFSRNAHQVYMGYRLSKKIEVGIAEDLPPYDTTPDIQFFLVFRFF